VKNSKVILEELNRIKYLFDYKKGKVISEQNVINTRNILSEKEEPAKKTTTLKVGDINFSYKVGQSTFGKTGEFLLDSEKKKEIDTALKTAKDMLEKTPNEFLVKIKFQSGESIIPSTKYKTGELSNLRMDNFKKYVEAFFGPNLFKKDVEVRKNYIQAKMTTEPTGGWNDYYRWSKLSDDKKISDPQNKEYSKLKVGYDKDQFSKIVINVVPNLGSYQCTYGLKIQINYDDSALGHRCDCAKFEIKANGVTLSTVANTSLTTLEGGQPWINLNNGRDGGLRYSTMSLDSKEIVQQIMNAATEPNRIILTGKCLGPFRNIPACQYFNYECHSDVPHLIVTDFNGEEKANTYPKGSIASTKQHGILAKMSACGVVDDQYKGTSQPSKDKGGVEAKVKREGKKLGFAGFGTLTTEQMLSNYVTDEFLVKNSDGTYTVKKTFKNGPSGFEVTYLPNDIVVKTYPSGHVSKDKGVTFEPKK